MTQRQRLDSLKQVFCGSEHANVFFNYPQVANNADEARLIYEACVQHGFEGVIVKAMDATYAPKRSKNWMKLKPVNTYDGTIKAFVEGEGEFVGMLGAMHIEGEDENGACFTAFVGSGLTQQQRAELWQDRESLIGRIVEVEAQEMTCVGDAHSLRFPVFIRFREDLK